MLFVRASLSFCATLQLLRDDSPLYAVSAARLGV
jgi:hypothetical protein